MVYFNVMLEGGILVFLVGLQTVKKVIKPCVFGRSTSGFSLSHQADITIQPGNP